MDIVAKTEYIDAIDIKTVNVLKKNGFFMRNANFYTKNSKADVLIAIESEIPTCDVANLALRVKNFLKETKLKNVDVLFACGKLSECEVCNKKVLGLVVAPITDDEVYSGIVASGCYSFNIASSINTVNLDELLEFLIQYEDSSNFDFSISNGCVSGKIYFYDSAVCESKMINLLNYLNQFDKIHGSMLMISSTRYCYPITNFEYYVETFSSLLCERDCFCYESEMGNLTKNNEGLVIRISNTEDCFERIKAYIKIFTEERNG